MLVHRWCPDIYKFVSEKELCVLADPGFELHTQWLKACIWTRRKAGVECGTMIQPDSASLKVVIGITGGDWIASKRW